MDALATRPRWRGRLHQVAFFVFLPLTSALVIAAQTALARLASAIYAVALLALYASSAALHRITWRPRQLAFMRRLDHSMIFVLIAGTYTPFALLVLAPPWSTTVLALVWGGALAGVLITALTPRLGWLKQALYMTLGWTAILLLPVTLRRMSLPMFALMVAGGLFYTVGAILFSLRKPDPWPGVFGYHEVWHVMVVAGSLCHYAFVALLVT